MEKSSVVPTPEKTNVTERNSLDFFVSLREKVLDTIGIPDTEEFQYSCYSLADLIAYRNKIHTSGEIQDNQNFTPEINKADLSKEKENIQSEIKKYEKYKPAFEALKEVELSPFVKETLRMYGKDTIVELFDENFAVADERFYGRMINVMWLASEAFVYRNRKISQFVAYRYARSVPLDIDLEEFVKNTHTILGVNHKSRPGDTPIQMKGYRQFGLNSDNEFLVPILPALVGPAMSEFKSHINAIEKTNDANENQREALKAFILFEIIHPFEDGNGRTGRSLFVFLQRYLSKDQNIGNDSVHIPIARYESPETMKAKDGLPGHPGSISFEIGRLVNKIITSKEIISLFDKTSPGQEMNVLVEELNSILDSQENKILLDDLLAVIKEQSAVDDAKSEDLNLVYESMATALKSNGAKDR